MKRANPAGFAADMMTLWFHAPMVIAMRSQQIALAMMAGRAVDMTEMSRMVTEKADALHESAVATNLALSKDALDMAAAAVTGKKQKSRKGAGERIAAAAVKPFAKRVRANHRRLGKKKV